MLQPIPDLPDNVVGVIASGQVTSDDYRNVLEPAISAALDKHERIRLLYVLGDEFDGYTGGAMWEDGKLGLEHFMSWEKCAVVADEEWIRHTINVMGYLIPGKVRTFDDDEQDEARAWIVA